MKKIKTAEKLFKELGFTELTKPNSLIITFYKTVKDGNYQEMTNITFDNGDKYYYAYVIESGDAIAKPLWIIDKKLHDAITKQIEQLKW